MLTAGSRPYYPLPAPHFDFKRLIVNCAVIVIQFAVWQVEPGVNPVLSAWRSRLGLAAEGVPSGSAPAGFSHVRSRRGWDCKGRCARIDCYQEARLRCL